MVERTVASFGGVDILVNNAQAWEPDRSVLDITDEILDIPFRSGLPGSLYTMQTCYAHLKARGGGSIVNFGSTTGVAGMPPGWAPYGIAKEAIRGGWKAWVRVRQQAGVRIHGKITSERQMVPAPPRPPYRCGSGFTSNTSILIIVLDFSRCNGTF
jgi:NAD(P)-dependent dehydrogenase (short-subunit alcohol dehydrogenase family)